FSGSAMSVLTMPRLNGSRPPNRLARLAPTRSWISAEPFRSTHSKSTVTLSRRSSATSAFANAIKKSIDDSTTPKAPTPWRARRSSVPLERSHAPHVREPDAEHRDEHRHLAETDPAQPPEDDRPRVHEHDLDVEDHEQDCGEVELDREADPADRPDR